MVTEIATRQLKTTASSASDSLTQPLRYQVASAKT